jgi:hypothetical protein
LRVLTGRVALDEVEVLHRHQQLAAAAVLDLHHLALGGAERDALQPAETPHAVVDVHDVVADFEVAQVGEERIRFLLAAADARRRGRLEEVPLRVRDDAQVVE